MNKYLNKRSIIITSAAAFAGAVLGYAYYYFIGCNTGSCPITSSPYISTLYGGIAGALLGFPKQKKKDEPHEN